MKFAPPIVQTDCTLHAITATQASIKRVVAPAITSSSRSCSLRPAPPAEKKWLYKQVLESVQSGISPQFNLTNSTLGRATSRMWLQLNSAQQQVQHMADEYQLKEKVAGAVKLVGGWMVAVKNFVILKQFFHLDRVIDRGLLALEEKIRATRERQVLPDESQSQSSPETGRKKVTKNCTTIMLKRDPCSGS
uniref:Uncharacterized protein n=1 Tax=Anopheles dirus TaxID=7168 RepID=A0A182NH18_9DIPT